ncbi:hypothetical protein ASA1KI_06520 [Opitutales bacterium ASA1]|uniref:PH domain-containing protein n=1 Tax=Congregicoccus parvus TaxID=3081749 RepID=UPI002B2F0A97|nr:hypothetical protein ASA1KI_06520 [Opitutales bacterium ASA1]
MIERLRRALLPKLRLPPEPQPPQGAPGSVRVFRAARGYYGLMVLAWAGKQTAAAFGLVFSIGVLLRLEADIADYERFHATETAESTQEQGVGEDRVWRVEGGPFSAARENVVELTAPRADWLLPLFKGLEVVGVVSFLVQLVVTFGLVRFEWELRWYMVTDRSLRIRSGIWTVGETTMSFANVQQIELFQGPVERLLGVSNIRVQSAGGGGGGGGQDTSQGREREHDSLHTAHFHGVENAGEIRDLIESRLRRYRETGLGDPDDAHESPAEAVVTTDHVPAIEPGRTAVEAAREVLNVVREWRAALR